VSNPTDPLPPTPPLRPGSSFDTRHQSPTTLFISGSDRQGLASAINDVEGNAQRQMNYPPIPQDRPLRPLQGPVSPYAASSYGSAGDASMASYQVSPVEGNAGSAVPFQRPLPSGFPPPSSYDEPSGQYISHATPAWQHHHHFPHSASTPYPPNQDRYICGTCNKAFSRPSSLKIHTHSHTGEKPWKCQIRGCGKTFSVRSNMKRHEKGCHGDAGFQNGDLGRVSPESAS
jgi:Zinc finger, C2H2 type